MSVYCVMRTGQDFDNLVGCFGTKEGAQHEVELFCQKNDFDVVHTGLFDVWGHKDGERVEIKMEILRD